MAATRPGVEPPAGARRVIATLCDEHYLGLVRLHPLRGRAFTPADISSAAHVVVISRSLAERYFGQEDPLGQYLDLPDLAKAPALLTDTRFSIIGVVEDVRNQGPSEVPWPGVYLPTTLTAAGNTPRRIVVRTAGDAASVLPALERAVRAVDLDVAVRSGVTLDDALKRSFHAQPRFSLVILTAFAAIGLALVAVGVYGVMAYAVSRRAQEFAIRMALGATREDVVRTVVRAGSRAARGGHRHWPGSQSDDEPPGGELRRDAVGRRRCPVVRPGRRRGHRAGRTGRLSDSGPPCVTDEPNGRAASGLTAPKRRCGEEGGASGIREAALDQHQCYEGGCAPGVPKESGTISATGSALQKLNRTVQAGVGLCGSNPKSQLIDEGTAAKLGRPAHTPVNRSPVLYADAGV